MNRQVKNRAPNPIQISAEQLVRDARERHLEDMPDLPTQYIEDQEELLEYQRNKRKDFEGQIMRARTQVGLWLRYARWEADQKEFARSRSVYERALDMDYKNEQIWMKYAEMEMKHKFINHARNVYDRAVTLLPRREVFWFKYTYMEELVGAVDQAETVFERWMKWEPEESAWMAYVKFNLRRGSLPAARGIMKRFVACHPTSAGFLKYAKWEEKHNAGDVTLTRAVYEQALQEVHHDEATEELMLSFAKFEERCDEIERARTIFRFALESLQGEDSAAVLAGTTSAVDTLKKEYLAFEKRHGTKGTIEEAVLVNRRAVYKSQTEASPRDYDAWFDWCRLEESEGSLVSARETFEKAVSFLPENLVEKRFWRRYIYLWINYALFEELQAKDVGRARDVYRAALDIVPHKHFTFGKLWIMAAHLEVRCKDLGAARKLLGTAIGMCGKESLFRAYIDLELQLGEVDRCRQIYTKFLETLPECNRAWSAYAKLEADVGETERARALFELAITQPALDQPESMWKGYIDFEAALGEYARVRTLYARLLERTQHVKVFISQALFELEATDGGVEAARQSFEDAYARLKRNDAKEARVLLLHAWRDMEAEAGVNGQLSRVEALLPTKIKMRRAVSDEEGGGGSGAGAWEEYFEYSFPDDEKKMPGLKILENAMKWKAMMKAGSAFGGGLDVKKPEAVTGGMKEAAAPAPTDDAEIDIDDI